MFYSIGPWLPVPEILNRSSLSGTKSGSSSSYGALLDVSPFKTPPRLRPSSKNWEGFFGFCKNIFFVRQGQDLEDPESTVPVLAYKDKNWEGLFGFCKNNFYLISYCNWLFTVTLLMPGWEVIYLLWSWKGSGSTPGHLNI